MKALVFGGNGQLGTDVVEEFRKNELSVDAVSHQECNIINFELVGEIIEKRAPDFVINCAAFHKVDGCEKDEAKAMAVNYRAVENMANICKKQKIVFVHISTDYVFDGEKKQPYTEEDMPHPINIYGKSKYEGEKAIQNIGGKYFILRVASLYGIKASSKQGGNFVETMIKLGTEKDEIKVVTDQYMTPTATMYVARQMIKLINTDFYGIYHCTCGGFCTWYEFAKEIFKLMNINIKLTPITSEQYYVSFKRPKYTVLENAKLKSLNIDIMPPWKEALQKFILLRNVTIKSRNENNAI